MAWLALRVHADALRFDPLGYFQAALWRLRGLRLRARNRIAALSGRSRHAYAHWIAREEPHLRAACLALGGARVAIRPVIDCRAGAEGLAATLASLGDAKGGPRPVVIGGPAVAGTERVDQPGELARLVEGADAWLCILCAGDRLAPGALDCYAGAAAGAAECRIVYADDDLIAGRQRRRAPHFKPDWNADLFEHHDFVTGAAIVRATRQAIAQAPADRWAEALVADAVESGAAPVRLPLVLHHRRVRPAPVIPARPTELLPQPARSVTAIIPTRNGAGLLRNCIDGLRRTAYPAIETIIVDNGSDEPETLAYLKALEAEGVTVLRRPGPFNYSALNNHAVGRARGELLCFLNNDLEMIDPDWLALLVRQAVRSELGAIGALLLYPDHSVQHAGVTIGIGGGAGHGHRLQRAGETGYFERAWLPQRISAVTGACLVVARTKFLAVGGFDEADFAVAFNDVDLCLKLNARGWQSFYEPRARLIHHESKSRGRDLTMVKRARFAGELSALKRKWATDRHRDPFHHPQLSTFCEQFLISV